MSFPTKISLMGIGFILLSACTAAQKEEGPKSSLSGLIDQTVAGVDREVEEAQLYSHVLQVPAWDTTKIINPSHVEEGSLLTVLDGKFSGTIEDLTKLVAREIDYKVLSVGEKPGSPIIITVVQNDISAIGLLREGYEQAKNRARLVINQQDKTLTLKYHRPEKSPVPSVEENTL